MTNRIQTLRSSVTGNTPASGTRQPGETWVNFADSQLGTIDASKNARALLAVRYFSASANYAAGDYVVQAGQLYRAKGAITAGAFNASQWTLTGGSVLVSAAAPSSPTPGDMWFDSAGGQLYVYYDDGNTQQWVIAVNQNMAAGVYLPLSGGTLTGDLILNRDPVVALGAATKAYADTKYAASNPSGYQTAAQVSASLGSYLPLTGGTLSGNLDVKAPLNAWTFAGGFAVINLLNGAGSSNSQISHADGTGILKIMNLAAGASNIYIAADTSFNATAGTCTKPGGGSWTAGASDARVKTVDGDYKLGLAEVCKLNPVRYRYKGNDVRHHENEPSQHKQAAEAQTPFVGLVAQAVETIFPGMVTQGEGWIDGEKVTDLRRLDPSELIYALVNAVKTLAAEVNALKAGAR